MRFPPRHPWNVSLEEAVALQDRLRQEVVCQDTFGPVRLVAGVDVGFRTRGEARAAVVVLQLPGLELSETAIGCCVTSFPYVPGLLSFREAPAVLAALENLEDLPDLLMYDGHGLAHPRRFGAASHIGLLTGIPTIGVAKEPLVGGHAAVPPERGAWQPVMAEGEIIGAALRTRSGTRPVYVSIGHRLSLATAIDYVLRCSRGFRLPEPTRWAHQLASGEMLAQTLPPKPSARDALP